MKKLNVNVLIVSYCQENLISRAIESVLLQGDDFFNKIIINDDNSTDGTWKVITNYVNMYPDKIEAYRNEYNLGIYGNLNKLLLLRGDADLFYFLAGDDAIEKGWHKTVYDFITNNKISLVDSVGIFSDFLVVTPNGKKIISKINSFVAGNRSLYSLHLRGMASIRSLMVSKSVMDKCFPVDTDKGIGFAESLFNTQFFLGIEKAYYFSCIGNIYYAGIGVSKDILEHDPNYFTNIDLIKYNLLNWANNDVDIKFLNSKLDAVLFLKTHRFTKLLKSVYNYILGMRGYPFNMKLFLRYYKWMTVSVIKECFRKNEKQSV